MLKSIRKVSPNLCYNLQKKIMRNYDENLIQNDAKIYKIKIRLRKL